MSRVITSSYQAEKIALEKIVLGEADLIRAERAREWRYVEKEKSDKWFAEQIADLEAWHDYLDRKHRDENCTGLGLVKPPPAAAPKSAPFPRTFVMLGDLAAGEGMCDEIGMLMVEIALIVSMQITIGVELGGHEKRRRSALEKLQPVVVADSTDSDVVPTKKTAAPTP